MSPTAAVNAEAVAARRPASSRPAGTLRGLAVAAVAAGLLHLGLGSTAQAGSNDLPKELRSRLAELKIPESAVSLYVRRVVAPGPLLALNAERPRNPASVAKLVTTLAALDVLGPAYTWRTEAHLDGPLHEGRLDGDLILKGYGDPLLTPEKFWQFLRELRGRGLERIGGDLLIDDSFIAPPAVDRSAFDGRPTRAYNALPNALSLNFQATRITLLPDQDEGRIRAFTYPPLDNLRIVDRAQLIDGPCRRGSRWPSIHIARRGALPTLEFKGRYSTQCNPLSFSRLLVEPQEQVAGTFRVLWSELGGRLDGEVRAGRLKDTARRFHRLESRPLGEIVRSMNKFSNNLMSRLVFLTLGAERFDAPADLDKARRVLSDWLTQQRLSTEGFFIDNGAGLSRDTRVSAELIGQLLRNAYFDQYMPEFMSSLSILGVDGTMRKRLRKTALVGRGHFKTGSLDEVKALAGYLLDRKGRRWVVVFLVNHPRADWRVKKLQDALLEWLHDRA